MAKLSELLNQFGLNEELLCNLYWLELESLVVENEGGFIEVSYEEETIYLKTFPMNDIIEKMPFTFTCEKNINYEVKVEDKSIKKELDLLDISPKLLYTVSRIKVDNNFNGFIGAYKTDTHYEFEVKKYKDTTFLDLHVVVDDDGCDYHYYFKLVIKDDVLIDFEDITEEKLIEEGIYD